MQLKKYFGTILQSLSPNKHKHLAKMPFFNLVKYFFFLSVLSLIVSVVILLPMITQYKSNLQQEMASFDTFSIDANVSQTQPSTILKKPRIVVDFNKENLTNEWILVNDKSVQYKKYIFFGHDQNYFSDYKSVKSEESASLYFKLMIFLLPAVLFWILVLFLIKYAFLILIFSFLGWIFFSSHKRKVSYKTALKVAIFTATPMVIIDLALWPIAVMYFVPIIIYIIFFIIGLLMVAERKKHHKHEEGLKWKT